MDTCEHGISIDERCPRCEFNDTTDRDLEFIENITFGDQ